MEDRGEHLNFAVKKYVWCGIVEELSSTLKTNFPLQEYQEDECMSLRKAQKWPLLKVPE